MGRRPPEPHPAVAGIDEAALAEFRAGIRRRYTDEQILAELRASAERLGRSPTMREFAADPETKVHPQTVIEHFGTWNAAKRAAGLVPRRFVTREELLRLLRELGEELGRTPTARDLDARRGSMPSKSLVWHTFGSLTTALREAGFDVPVGEERLERAVEQGAALARRLGRLPKMADWKRGAQQRRHAADGVAGLPAGRRRRRPWAAFQFLVRERLRDEGAEVLADGSVSGVLGRGRDRGEALEAARAFVRRAHGGKSVLARGRAVGWKLRARRCDRSRSAGAGPRRPPACGASSAACARPPRAHHESRRRRPRRTGPDPERPADAAGEMQHAGVALVDPRGRHRAATAPRTRARRSGAPRRGRRSPRSRRSSRGSARCRAVRAKISSSFTMIPLWMPTTEPCRIGWLLATIVGWPLV